MKKYPNLVSTGSMLVTYGNFIKGIAVIIGLIGIIAGLIMTLQDHGMVGRQAGIMLLAVGVIAGLTIHVLGTVVAAAGEALHALADIASNSWGSTPSNSTETIAKNHSDTLPKYEKPISITPPLPPVNVPPEMDYQLLYGVDKQDVKTIAGALVCRNCGVVLTLGEMHKCK